VPEQCLPLEQSKSSSVCWIRYSFHLCFDLTNIGTGIAAVNSTNRLRVYFQDVYGSIRESLYEGGWGNGTEKNVIGKAKLGSPVAATSKELTNVCYYRPIGSAPD
jgi:hypothetical protein